MKLFAFIEQFRLCVSEAAIHVTAIHIRFLGYHFCVIYTWWMQALLQYILGLCKRKPCTQSLVSYSSHSLHFDLQGANVVSEKACMSMQMTIKMCKRTRNPSLPPLLMLEDDQTG